MTTEAELREQALACEKANEVVGFRRVYYYLAGDVVSALLLGQIMYWHGNDKETGSDRRRVKREGKLWVAKTYHEWFDEVPLTKYQVSRAMGRLEDKGFIETRVFKFKGVPTKHVRICWDVFTPALVAASTGQPLEGPES